MKYSQDETTLTTMPNIYEEATCSTSTMDRKENVDSKPGKRPSSILIALIVATAVIVVCVVIAIIVIVTVEKSAAHNLNNLQGM